MLPIPHQGGTIARLTACPEKWCAWGHLFGYRRIIFGLLRAGSGVTRGDGFSDGALRNKRPKEVRGGSEGVAEKILTNGDLR